MTSPSPSGLIFYFLIWVQASAFAQNKPSGSSLDLRPLASNVNTEADETVAFRYADKLYFSSEVKHEKTGKHMTRIFSVLRDGPAFPLRENPKELTRHMAHLTFNLKADRMYFTLFRKDRNGQMTNGEIWYRDRNYDGTWNRQERPPEPLNLYGSMTLQPAFGFDRISGKELLFFVSDRPGGKGGLDIWASEINHGLGDADDVFDEPINLPFNTSGDEMSPFFDTQSQTLFFSSNGHEGLGGLDVFRTKKQDEDAWEEPFHFKDPINSEHDEKCFSFHHSSGLAYFSSNRPSTSCEEEVCKNFDIYQVKLKAEVLLHFVNAITKNPLAGCNVELTEIKSGKVLETRLDLPEGETVFDVELGKPYQVIVSQKGYYPVFLELLASQEELFSTLEKTILLKPMRSKAVEFDGY